MHYVYICNQKKIRGPWQHKDILLYIVKKEESKLRTLRCLLGIFFFLIKKEKQRTDGQISGRRIKRPWTVRLSLNLESAPLLPSVVSTAKTLNPSLLPLPLQSARVFARPPLRLPERPRWSSGVSHTSARCDLVFFFLAVARAGFHSFRFELWVITRVIGRLVSCCGCAVSSWRWPCVVLGDDLF